MAFLFRKNSMKASNYVAKALIKSTCLALLLLLSIHLFFSFVNELSFVGKGDYGVFESIGFLILTIPQEMGEWFPFSLLLGTLLGLGALHQQQELLILRLGGLSLTQIFSFALRAGVLMALVVFLISEGVGPGLSAKARELKAFKISSGQAMRTTQGTWFRDGAFFIHVSSIRADNLLLGVTRYELAEGRLAKISFAKQAHFQGDHWLLEQVEQTEFLPSSTEVHRFKTLNWPSQVNPSLLTVLGVKHLEDLALWDLWQSLDFREANHLDSENFALAIWRKLLQPLSALVLLFLAFPFVFGPLRQANAGFRWLIGVVLGLSFYLINAATGPISLVAGISPVLGAFLPSILFFCFGLVLLRRV